MFSKVCFVLISIFVSDLSHSQSSTPLRSTQPTVHSTTPTAKDSQNCTKFSTNKEYWLQFNNNNETNNCYYLSTQWKLSWYDADDFCRAKNATMVSIHSGTINYLLSHYDILPGEIRSSYFWIGLNSLTQRGQYKWSDSSEVEYFNFANVTSNDKPLPPDVLDQDRCVMIKSLQKDIIIEYNEKHLGEWFKEGCSMGNAVICQRSMVTRAVSTPAPSVRGNCPPDWFQYANQKCIKYVNESLTFKEAALKCVHYYKGEVLSIHSEKEQDFVTAYTAGKPEPYIGITREKDYPTWYWYDDKKVNFTNWGILSYNYSWTYPKDLCAVIVTNESQPGNWIDVLCSERHPVLCEKVPDTNITEPGKSFNGNKCKISGFEDFIQYRNSCYLVLDSNSFKLSFSDAEKKCRAINGSHLVSLIDPFEEAFLSFYLKQYGKSDMYWIGLQSQLSSDSNVSQLFEWTDDWPVYYTHWDQNEPKFAAQPQNKCVSLVKSNGTWRTTSCNSSLAFVCKTTSDSLPKMNADKSGVCPNLNNITDKSMLWVDIDRRSQYCYWFSVDDNEVMSWNDASFQCRRRNGALLSIHSYHEFKLLKIKFNQTRTNYNTWIGLTNDPKGNFIWVDGSALDYTNWDPNEKIITGNISLNHDSRPQCVEVSSPKFMWKQQPCSGNKRNYFICAAKKIYHTHSTESESSTQTTSKPPITTQKTSTSSGLSKDAKIGIYFGAIGGVALIIVFGFLVLRKHRSRQPVFINFENSLYTSRRGNRNGQVPNEPTVTFSKTQ